MDLFGGSGNGAGGGAVLRFPAGDAPSVALCDLTVYAYIDTAACRTDSSDMAAMVVGGVLPEAPRSAVYLLDARVGRYTLTCQARMVLSLAARYGAQAIGHEVAGQFSVAELIRREYEADSALRMAGPCPRLCGITHRADKLQRAARFEALLSSDAVRVSSALPTEFMEQCRAFPAGGEHDDAPDALIGLLEVIRRCAPTVAAPPYSVPSARSLHS